MRFSLLPLLMFLVAGSAQAAISVVAQYRLGEDDPGAVAFGTGADPTLPSVGAINLSRTGSPSYSPTTPPFVNSTLSMAFNGNGDRYTGAVVSTATDNFGVEAWVKSNGNTANNATLVYNGNSGNSGWGLFRAGSAYGFLYGGVTLNGLAPVTTNWTHLALVRDAGVTSLYVNGQRISTAAGAPAAPAGSLLIGGNPMVATESFDGLIDEVRVFTFQPGQFQVADLNLGSPEPPIPVPAVSSQNLALLAALLLLAGLWIARRHDA